MIKISDKHKHFWGKKIPTEKDLQSYCEELNLDFKKFLFLSVCERRPSRPVKG